MNSGCDNCNNNVFFSKPKTIITLWQPMYVIQYMYTYMTKCVRII